jgi:uncharacterized protein YukE
LFANNLKANLRELKYHSEKMKTASETLQSADPIPAYVAQDFKDVVAKCNTLSDQIRMNMEELEKSLAQYAKAKREEDELLEEVEEEFIDIDDDDTEINVDEPSAAQLAMQEMFFKQLSQMRQAKEK